eukprot:TRINITY_DN3172_c0_g1_i1.p1 TRINITY_DN3172_c0_g1~~TRINITY_DN3172_c0_g1_i1.p1  ORF type:complete len:115 (-),score=16.40 TRINITY_DN3172_c0_g1_i1:55-399(-)
MTSGKTSTTKALTFITAVDISAIIDTINEILPQYAYDGKTLGTYFLFDEETEKFSLHMDHDIQKYLEEDIIVLVFDIMYDHGYVHCFEFDQVINSMRALSASVTSKEVFVFTKA